MENRHANDHPGNVSSFRIDDRKRGKEKRCLGCLPIEILLIILNHLSVADYMSFPFVCKCWRSAFRLCSPLISEKNANRIDLPWFVLLKLEPKSAELKTTGKIGDLSTRCVYTSTVPELCGSRILLSRHGWLLLFSSGNNGGSLFFLNPFSRARIDIPLFLDDMSESTCPVFDTSAPPTSPDCIVFLVCFCKEEGGAVRKISMCRRGESVWQTNIYKGCASSPVVNTVFVDGILYCLHEHGFLSTFDVVTRSCEDVERLMFCGPGLVSHRCQRDNGVYLCIYGYGEDEVELKRSPMLSSRHITTSDPEYLFRYLQPYVNTRSELRLDTFNTRAWCIGTSKQNDRISFRWHAFANRVQYSSFHPHPPDNDCSTFVMWVQPIWVDRSSTNLSWMS